MDFNEDVLLTECILVGMVSKGIFAYQDIRNLIFKSYDLLLKNCREVYTKINSPGDKNNG